ncbi:hypothetical protein llap_13831 [Limosa lapponica baueri]|uniref:DnaJ homolog subfamily C member 2 n=1 Tax=Limosa lapponica baueri TaxID=1758121 RepID=A0A2I0TQ18_LIMLA|nr:hypothetical protein llap_13831 [Limosa lapponica baueri]
MLRGAQEGQVTAVTRALSAASVLCQVEPVGRWFEAFIKRRNINVSASFQELEDEKELSEESGDEELQLEEFPMLKTLDPKDWKNQDHYAVLGLGNIRYRATQKQIKAAHKSMVLKHHPDKRKAAGEQIGEGDNDYFTCITKAYEILSDPVKRRAFNSIDPTFDNSVPSKSEAKENFFEVFSPVFERNARCDFKGWYNFDSWREFSYLDEEEKEKAEWYQRQAELEAARLAKEKEEEEVRQQALVAKKEKEIQKKAIKKERQKLRTTCKNWNYFSDNEADCVKMMEEVEKLCDRLELARWEVIANYMNLHSTTGIKRTAKDVINKAKSLQKLGSPLDSSPWTTEEQKLLEQALKTYPVNTPERWEKIAAAVPGRSKKDCMKRYKELVEMVKAKKAAQEQVMNATKVKK